MFQDSGGSLPLTRIRTLRCAGGARRSGRAADACADRHRALAGVISREEAVLRIVAANPGRFPAAMRRVRRAEARCEAAGGECARRGHAIPAGWPLAAVPRRR